MRTVILAFLALALPALAQSNHVTILSLTRGIGPSWRAQIETGRTQSTILLQGLPADTIAAYQRKVKLEAEVAREENRLDQEDADIDIGLQSVEYDSPAYRQYHLRAARLRADRTALAKQRRASNLAAAEWDKRRQVSIQPTGQVYAGLKVWQLTPNTPSATD